MAVSTVAPRAVGVVLGPGATPDVDGDAVARSSPGGTGWGVVEAPSPEGAHPHARTRSHTGAQNRPATWRLTAHPARPSCRPPRPGRAERRPDGESTRDGARHRPGPPRKARTRPLRGGPRPSP